MEIMADAGELVLGRGKRCRVGKKIVKYPDRYMDKRGAVMFETVVRLLEEVERAEEQEVA
jgi:DNA polymerase I